MNLLLVTCVCLIGQTKPSSSDDEARVRAAIAVERARLELLAKKNKTTPGQPTYEQAQKLALDSSSPLVVFAGVPARKVGGCVVFQGTKEMDSRNRPSVLIYYNNSGHWLNALRYDPGVDILDAIGRELARQDQEVSQRADPFDKYNALVIPDAQGVDKATGPWPKTIPFPKGLKPFKKAQNRQIIDVMMGEGDRITKVSRFDLEEKWNVPGGMVGIEGWRSDLYQLIPTPPKVWVGDIGVVNSYGFTQQNRGWKRNYAEGTEFHDVLSYNGEVFEHRVRKKVDGQWESGSIYRNPDARPPGYTGLNQQCSECHTLAGTGSYSKGLFPGGDTVFSDPFPALQ